MLTQRDAARQQPLITHTHTRAHTDAQTKKNSVLDKSRVSMLHHLISRIMYAALPISSRPHPWPLPSRNASHTSLKVRAISHRPRQSRIRHCRACRRRRLRADTRDGTEVSNPHLASVLSYIRTVSFPGPILWPESQSNLKDASLAFILE